MLNSNMNESSESVVGKKPIHASTIKHFAVSRLDVGEKDHIM